MLSSSPLPPAFHSKKHCLTPMKPHHGQISPLKQKQRSPGDRFIPVSTSHHSFKMSSPPHTLSQADKIIRRKTSNSSEYFRPARRTLSRNIEHSIAIRTQSGRRGGSSSGVWSVGSSPGSGGVSSRITVPLFGDGESAEEENARHEGRLAIALGVDRKMRVMAFKELRNEGLLKRKRSDGFGGSGNLNIWREGWVEHINSTERKKDNRMVARRQVPVTPFRVLDAPGLRDDFYCSLLAYSPVTHSLAVGLNSEVYSWTELNGAQPFEPWSTSHVTCLAFSSELGRQNILAIGRIDGQLSLWKPGEPAPRIQKMHNAGVAAASWRPTTADNQRASVEELIVGDEMGVVYYYRIEWNGPEEDSPPAPVDAAITLVRKIIAHTQQICGLAWSIDGLQFATGGNDNLACLFDVTPEFLSIPRDANTVVGGERYRWIHGAAVKAIAFCPWQKSLLATGGGSNDRSIHFFHTYSGSCLATINVSAQVTSLLWSKNHREIAATFGYANPDHPVRIAVFSWPECVQVVAIPWQEDMRALYGIAYPCGTDRQTRDRSNGADTEGCIIVAASDETVRFHEVWKKGKRDVIGWKGVLGGSDILEGLEGIEADGGELIR